MTNELFLTAAAIILIAYFIRGITGSGSGLIAIPLLAHFFPLTFVVPLILVLDTSASIILSLHTKLHVQWQEIKILLPSSLIGITSGALLLISLPREPLLIGLGIFVFIFGLRYVLNLHSDNPISAWWAIPTGFIGGLIGAMFGTGGPPYIVYLSHRLRDKTQLVGTLSGLFMIDGLIRVMAFLYLGLFIQADLLYSLLISFPLMSLGLFLGQKVHLQISRRAQLALIGVLLLLSGSSLIWKALA
ncbi:MAG: sulfite exporter TauE/SafE family protein [Gammaproteobacteria bacterium]|nr:sulfite exporter TauE/SafE family protein [Gammaproteobacteria bacterium]